MIAKGQMSQGATLLKKAQEALIRNERRVHYALSEYILGEVNLQIATGPKPSFSIIAKNIGFLTKNMPFATKHAEEHFDKAVKIFQKTGAKSYLGLVKLSLGLLYKTSGKTDQSRKCLLEAIDIFQGCEAELYLKQAKEALNSLN